jgi:hypothetical protein
MDDRRFGGPLPRTLAFWAALLALGCAPESPRAAPTALLRAHFPQHADRVLGVGGPGLVATPDGRGFVPAPPAGVNPVTAAEATLAQRRGLRAVLPARGDGAVRMSTPDGFTIEIRETGLTAPGRLDGGAVAYDRGHGEGSFWSATDGGYEEWLLARPAPDGAVASWEVRGAVLRATAETVELLDGSGAARLRMTAPAAYAEAAIAVPTRLTVDRQRITLWVERPRGDAVVLVDPLREVTGRMISGRLDHTATLLTTGRVLIAGGAGAGRAAELYDPFAGTFAATGPLATARSAHAATLLPWGKGPAHRRLRHGGAARLGRAL